MKVKILKACVHPGQYFEKDKEYDVDDASGKRLVAIGNAIDVTPPPAPAAAPAASEAAASEAATTTDKVANGEAAA